MYILFQIKEAKTFLAYRRSLSFIFSFIQTQMFYFTCRKLVRALCYGQVLSLLLCGTAVTSGLLQEENVSIPTGKFQFQSVDFAIERPALK
jgi:hypothetical protein